jgi:hypothetical protein
MLRGNRREKPGREITPRSGRFVQPTVARFPAGYSPLLEDLKIRIRQAQVKAAFSVNHEFIALYWHIGRSIIQRQQSEGWGRSVIDRLSADIQAAFSSIAGFSPSNISRMRAFYLAYAQGAPISAEPVPKSKGADSALSTTGGKGFILATGFTIYPGTLEENVRVSEKIRHSEISI